MSWMGSRVSQESPTPGATRRPGLGEQWLAFVVCALLAACSGSGSSGTDASGPGGPGDPGGDGSGSAGGGEEDDDRDTDPGAEAGEEDEGDFDDNVEHDIDPPVEGDEVARLEMAAPESDQFVIHATFPTPKGVFPTADGSVPFAVVDWDGTPVPSQVEAVAFWPNSDDGADVVEILARVERDPTAVPGDRVEYPVVFSPHEPASTPPSASLATLKNTTHAVPSAVQDLFDDTSSVTIRARDCFGNAYEHDILAASHKELLRGGRATSQIVTYGTLMPKPAVSGNEGTLPHLFGVHAYLTTWSGEPVVSLDLRISNGDVDLDSGTSADDALGVVYFESLEVLVPSDWKLAQAFDDPGFGDKYTEGDRAVYPIVQPLEGSNSGKLNVMPWQGQFHRRLALTPPGGLSHGRALLDMEGQAFCVRGHDESTDKDYYSWWNPGTARYLQQRSLLPSLDHIGLTSIRNQLNGKFNDLVNHKKNGTDKDGYPIVAGHMGWAHPWGVAYGGMTGGDEIQFFEGVETACAGSNEGFRYLQLLHRMQSDRQGTAAFRADGQPTNVGDWLQTNGVDHVPFNYFLVANGGSDPFGVNDSPGFQRTYVNSTGKTPSFKDFLLSFDPHDFQHYSRYTRAPMALAWLGNDALSKFDLRASAEVFELSFHQYANNSGGGTQGSGMKAKIQSVANNPGVGTTLGRGEGHGTACMNAAYALADAEWRAGKLEWYEALTELTSDAVSTCNGFVQSFVISKGLDGKYRVRQAIEQYIYDNAMRGVVETVWRGANPALAALLNDYQEQSLYASISELAWEAGHNDPWSWTAVAPLSGAPFCDPSELPADWHEDWHEGHNIWSSFGYGYWLTGDTVFFDFAKKASQGSGDALTALENQGLENIDNRAATLAALQLQAGVL